MISCLVDITRPLGARQRPQRHHRIPRRRTFDRPLSQIRCPECTRGPSIPWLNDYIGSSSRGRVHCRAEAADGSGGNDTSAESAQQPSGRQIQLSITTALRDIVESKRALRVHALVRVYRALLQTTVHDRARACDYIIRCASARHRFQFFQTCLRQKSSRLGLVTASSLGERFAVPDELLAQEASSHLFVWAT